MSEPVTTTTTTNGTGQTFYVQADYTDWPLTDRVAFLERELAALREQIARIAVWRPRYIPTSPPYIPAFTPWARPSCPACGRDDLHTCVTC